MDASERISNENSRGEKNRRSKLTQKQVIQIRREYREGLRGKLNAHKFNISANYYNQIGRGWAWSWLTTDDS
jgi:YesN/AraC family two-component response regulator